MSLSGRTLRHAPRVRSAEPPPPLAELALIGDTRTAALCGADGTIHWLCMPRFDSDPVFGTLVDPASGGRFTVAPERSSDPRQRYRDGSAVLETTWTTAEGRVRCTDGMVTHLTGSLSPQAVLVRRVEALDGPARVLVVFDPRYGLPGRPPRTRRDTGTTICCWDAFAVSLRTDSELGIEPARPLAVEVEPGRPLTLVLTCADREPLVSIDAREAWRAVERTDAWWRIWSRDIAYDGPFRDAVVRSLITLRLLTYTPTGAPVAAPTTSLPERIGGARNWDYRYAWPRDASIGVAAFLELGKAEEATAFLHWLLHTTRLTRPRIGVLYTLFGGSPGRERLVDGVDGYRGSAPVRVGNAASAQQQLDVYGWVIDAAWAMVRAGVAFHAETARALRGSIDEVARCWRRPDHGIWEDRGAPRQWVHSKLMAWLALDRGVRMAGALRASDARAGRWAAERDLVAASVRTEGFDASRGTYVGEYSSADLDASLLLLPIIGLDGRDGPRVRATVDAIRTDLDAGDGLLYRSRRHAEIEGAFLPCSFWLVQALACLGRTREATELLHRLVALSGTLGSFPEEIDRATGAFTGNHPLALTHAALIQSALAIRDATGVG